MYGTTVSAVLKSGMEQCGPECLPILLFVFGFNFCFSNYFFKKIIPKSKNYIQKRKQYCQKKCSLRGLLWVSVPSWDIKHTCRFFSFHIQDSNYSDCTTGTPSAHFGRVSPLHAPPSLATTNILGQILRALVRASKDCPGGQSLA